ncbi:hypothetical protein ABE504_00345 [Paenibacillus oryzisoli]|uniref:hypothetical protein n=1 Tax=Paenibacillus oryzisoli TaxID=1850517 RepID=UPI003D2BE879
MYELKLKNNEAFVMIDGVEVKLETIINAYKQHVFVEEHHNRNKEMTDAIFTNDDILSQLQGSEMESDESLIMSKKDFMRVIKEVQ